MTTSVRRPGRQPRSTSSPPSVTSAIVATTVVRSRLTSQRPRASSTSQASDPCGWTCPAANVQPSAPTLGRSAASSAVKAASTIVASWAERVGLPLIPVTRRIGATFQVMAPEILPVAGVLHVDVARSAQTGRRIERSRGDRDRRAVGARPEQPTAALAAERPLGAVVGVPAKPPRLDQLQVVAGAGAVGGGAAVRAGADGAVADEHVAQGAGDAIANGAAEAAARVGCAVGHVRRVAVPPARIAGCDKLAPLPLPSS